MSIDNTEACRQPLLSTYESTHQLRSYRMEGNCGGPETSANLASDYEFTNFKPSKFCFSNISRDLKAQLSNTYA